MPKSSNPPRAKSESPKEGGWIVESGAATPTEGPPPRIPSTHEVPKADRPAPAAATGDLAGQVQTVHGLAWASHVGWGVAAFGFALAAYSYWWAVENYPTNYNPGGLPADKIGIVLGILGIIAGVVFIFVPRDQPGKPTVAASKSEWGDRAYVASYYWKASRILSWVGVGMFLLGLLLLANTYRAQVTAGPDTPNYTMLGTEASWGMWQIAFMLIALAGAFLWATFAVRSASYRSALVGFIVAARGGGSSQAAMPAVGATSPAIPAEMPSGVKDEEVVALMRKIDGLLAALPDDVVAAFSKTPEAETYLKLLGGKP